MTALLVAGFGLGVLLATSFPAAAPRAAGMSVEHGAAVLAGVALGTLTWYRAVDDR